MVLGKLPVPGRPTYLEWSRARAYCAFSRCGWGCLEIFSLVYHFSFSFSLSLGDGPIQTEILSQRAVKPKTTNQPTNLLLLFSQFNTVRSLSTLLRSERPKLYGVLVVLNAIGLKPSQPTDSAAKLARSGINSNDLPFQNYAFVLLISF